MAKTPIAQPSDYGHKHPQLNHWNNKIVKRTKNSPAVFKPGPVTPREFAAMFDDSQRSNTIPAGSEIGDVELYWLEFDEVIGASRGVETQFVLIKRDAGLVHARPVSEHELRHTFGVKK